MWLRQSVHFNLQLVCISLSTDPDPGPIAVVGFTETVVTVTEDVGAKLACIILSTDFPLPQDVTVQITSFDITAMSLPTFFGKTAKIDITISYAYGLG